MSNVGKYIISASNHSDRYVVSKIIRESDYCLFVESETKKNGHKIVKRHLAPGSIRDEYADAANARDLLNNILSSRNDAHRRSQKDFAARFISGRPYDA